MQNPNMPHIETGTDVYGSDGEKIGSVAGVADTHFVVEKGFILTTDIYVPMSALAGVEDDRVMLSMTKEQIENADWSNEPIADRDDGHDDGHDHDHDHDHDHGAVDAAAAPVATGTLVDQGSHERLIVDGEVDETGHQHVGRDTIEDHGAMGVDDRPLDQSPDSGATHADDSTNVPVREDRLETPRRDGFDQGDDSNTGTPRDNR